MGDILQKPDNREDEGHTIAPYSEAEGRDIVTQYLRIVMMFLLLTAALSAEPKDDRAEVLLQAAIKKEMVDGDLNAALEQYKRILAAYKDNRAVSAKALLQMAQCYEKLDPSQARTVYDRLLREYPDQKSSVTAARSRLASITGPVDAPKQTAINTRKLFESWDVVSGVSWSAGGRWLLYASRLPAVRALIMQNLETGQQRIIRQSGANESIYTAKLSPDEKSVVYRIVYANRQQELRIIGVDGTRDRLLFTSPEVQASWPHDWSPSGKDILASFERRDRTNQLVLISTVSGSIRVLKSFDWIKRPRSPRYTADGKFVVYAAPQGNDRAQSDIYCVAADGSSESVLVKHPANDYIAGLAPDGRLVFYSDRNGPNDLWAVGIENGKTHGEPELIQRQLPDVSLDSYVATNGTLHYGLLHKMTGAYTMEIDAIRGKVISAPAHVTATARNQNLAPAYSPDGRAIAVASFGPPSWRPFVIIRQLDSGEERMVHPTDIGNVYSMLWHPNGSSLLIRGYDRQSRWGIHELDIATGKSKLLMEALMNDFSLPAISPDGTLLYYVFRDRDRKLEMLREKNLADSSERDVYTVPQGDAELSYVLSPDARSAVMFSGQWNAGKGELIDVKSGNVLRTLPRRAFAPAWTPDGEYLVGIDANPTSGKQEIWRMAVNTGETAWLEGANPERARGEIRISPDGKHLTFFSLREVAEFWAMKNLIPQQRVSR